MIYHSETVNSERIRTRMRDEEDLLGGRKKREREPDGGRRGRRGERGRKSAEVWKVRGREPLTPLNKDLLNKAHHYTNMYDHTRMYHKANMG